MKHSPFEMGLSSAEVIARRLPGMWLGLISPTPASQSELMKMVVEKQMAFVEGCFAMQTEMFKMMLSPQEAGSHDRLMQAALAPSARRVKANLRRLRG
jgi:hypothetical protein